MTIGIYLLKFSSGAFYIGQSIDIERRVKQHSYKLINNQASSYMQIEYEYCKELPSYEILEICNILDLDKREEYYINKLNATIYPGINMQDKPNSPGSGATHACAKYSDDQYEKVFFLLLENKLNYKEISHELGVSKEVVVDISTGSTHHWLKERYPEEYVSMLSITRHIRPNRPLLQAPDGSIYDLSGKNVFNFAKENNLDASNLTAVLNGKRGVHKGWQLYKAWKIKWKNSGQK